MKYKAQNLSVLYKMVDLSKNVSVLDQLQNGMTACGKHRAVKCTEGMEAKLRNF